MTKIQRWLLLPLPILLSVGISLAVWGPRNEAPLLRVAVPVGPASATFYVALEQNLFSPLRVKHQPFASGRLALDALLGGGAELALVAETPVVFAALNSKDFRILAVVAQSPHKFVRRSAPAVRDGPPPKPTYGVPMGTAAQYWMERYLSNEGLTTSDVITLNVQAEDLVAALVNGSIAGFFSWEPYASRARALLGKEELDMVDSRGLYTQFFVLVALPDTIKHDRQRLEEFVASLHQASRAIADDTRHAVPIVAQYSEMRVRDVEAIWGDHNFSVSLPPSLLDTMSGEAAWAIRSGQASSRQIDFADFVDPSLLRAVCPECVTIGR